MSKDNLIGKKYNKLTILEVLPKSRVIVLCECGNIKNIFLYSVINGSTKTCGCEQRTSRIKYKVGDKHGYLTITEVLPGSMVEAKCECGATKKYVYQSLKRGLTKSCGCLNSKVHTKHGLCSHPLYSVWEGMVQRCYNPNHKAYKHYGGKGVTICDEWRNDFGVFLKWALENGWRKGLKIDKDIKAKTNGPAIYGPEYCSIVTQSKNLRNREGNRVIEYLGESRCMKEWAEIIGISYSALRARLDRGWSIDRAFKNENFIHNKLKKSA
jgi:hypothetical protein